jgi:hypothetical protein
LTRSVIPVSALAMLVLAAPRLTACTAAKPQALRGNRLADRSGDAVLSEFEGLLAANASATAALEQWCARRALAPTAQVRATLVGGGPDAGPADLRATLRQALGAGPDEPLSFRHVQLDCGGVVLSEAFNWYLPTRLAAGMNDLLETTRTPFGKVVAPLGYQRELIEARRGSAGGCPPGVILSHRAMLRLPDGRPLALLVECYTRANLGR